MNLMHYVWPPVALALFREAAHGGSLPGTRRAMRFLFVLLSTLLPAGAIAQTRNGFDLSSSLVPADEILGGGPPRDGIPALTDPAFEPVADVDWLRPDDRLLTIERRGIAKAYPIRILNWHEVVNDRIGDTSVLVTYCPLCGTGMAFDPRIEGRRRRFGVSGLLYNSDVLMYDQETESLWSQIRRQAISGPLRGRTLEPVPLVHTTWGRWRAIHPDGLVLSRDTGQPRDYARDPYLEYAREPGTMFPVAHEDPRLSEKTMVLGLGEGDAAVAFPLDRLAEHPRPVRAQVGARELFVYWFPDSWTAFATTLRGEPVPATLAFWFAWSAFHPATEIWEVRPAR